MTAMPGGGPDPDDIRAGLPAEDAFAYAEALRLILGAAHGQPARSAPPAVIQALADIAWGEAVARRVVTGMSHDVAMAQAAADLGRWMVAFRLPDLAGG